MSFQVIPSPAFCDETYRQKGRQTVSNIEFDAMIDINDPDFASKLADAIGLKPSETLEITTPQFSRTDGLQVPLPVFDFSQLPQLSELTLKAVGCQKWDEPDAEGNVLWLFPAEWYDHIPNGTIVHVISGKSERFQHGETDDDRRFGALAYGFMRKEPTP